ncbi:hypothetical protein ILYODFUR_011978 [Ilyodon furcidens]|uniref:Uncharacterized protein n=1 Tax=Ilyodon furcidens TaxID=33524 RepID=A0ABV0TLY2_9TELE
MSHKRLELCQRHSFCISTDIFYFTLPCAPIDFKPCRGTEKLRDWNKFKPTVGILFEREGRRQLRSISVAASLGCIVSMLGQAGVGVGEVTSTPTMSL